MKGKKRVVAKAQKKRRRNRQEYIRQRNDPYFEDRQPKDGGLSASDDSGILAMATITALLTRRRH